MHPDKFIPIDASQLRILNACYNVLTPEGWKHDKRTRGTRVEEKQDTERMPGLPD